MTCVLRVLTSAALAVALLACSGTNESGILITVQSVGVEPRPIASLRVDGTSLASKWSATSTFSPPVGETEILLPTTLALRLTGGRDSVEGSVEVCVVALDAADASIASACATADVVRDEVAELAVTLVFSSSADSAVDSGADSSMDMGTDAGLDAGNDGGLSCGNGIREGAEDCDGLDLAGAACASLGFTGGVLACDISCAFDTVGCTGPPTTPVQRKPINASFFGSVHVAGSLRPLFSWEPSLGGGTATIMYELDYSTDSIFPGAQTTTVSSAVANHQPAADLTVSLAPPVGARYYWRVRACAMAACSPYSPTWYVDVGRSDRDFNGDGYADAVMSASEGSEPTMGAGAFYVFFGGPSGAPDTTADGVAGGNANLDRFGSSASPAGDVNGDGFIDLVVGAMTSDGAGVDSGAAFLYFGGPGVFDTTADATWTGEAAGDRLGASVASAGDVNADGYADIILGAFRHDTGGPEAGRAYVYLGGPGPFDVIADGVLTGAGDENFGWEVNTAGDVNGDGYADVIIGADTNDVGGNNAGAAHLFLGGAGPMFDETEDALIVGTTGDQLGISVDTAGDVNGDGFSDVIVGAYLADLGAMSSGAAYVFLGGPGPFDINPDGALAGEASGDFLGSVVARAGDVNGDEFDDVIVGAPFNDVGGNNAGRAYVFFGGPGATLDNSPDGTLTGPGGADGQFGMAVGLAGDLNGDGFDDVIVGAGLDNAAGPLRGGAYIYLGASGTSLNAGADGSYFGTSDLAAFGSWVASLTLPRLLSTSAWRRG